MGFHSSCGARFFTWARAKARSRAFTRPAMCGFSLRLGLKPDHELSLVLRTSESLLFARAKRSNPEKHGDPPHSLSPNGGTVARRAWVRGRRVGVGKESPQEGTQDARQFAVRAGCTLSEPRSPLANSEGRMPGERHTGGCFFGLLFFAQAKKSDSLVRRRVKAVARVMLWHCATAGGRFDLAAKLPQLNKHQHTTRRHVARNQESDQSRNQTRSENANQTDPGVIPKQPATASRDK
jgi:hypothetical protein